MADGQVRKYKDNQPKKQVGPAGWPNYTGRYHTFVARYFFKKMYLKQSRIFVMQQEGLFEDLGFGVDMGWWNGREYWLVFEGVAAEGERCCSRAGSKAAT